MLRMLSYPIHPDAPTFMRYFPPQLSSVQAIARRQNVNTARYELHSNTGTHLIAPRHVHDDGYSISDLPPEKFHYQRPVVIDVTLPQTWLIGSDELEPHADAIANCDLLLVRTGFSQKREADPAMYRSGNPGFSPSAATYLIEKFPDLKAVGMDFIYPSSAHHLSRGLAFQQIILGSADRERFILLIADLNLEGDFTGLEEVWALPLMVVDGPSAPCTVVARFRPPAPAGDQEGGNKGGEEQGGAGEQEGGDQGESGS